MFVDTIRNTSLTKFLAGKLSLSRRKPDLGETVTNSSSMQIFNVDSFSIRSATSAAMPTGRMPPTTPVSALISTTTCS